MTYLAAILATIALTVANCPEQDRRPPCQVELSPNGAVISSNQDGECR